MITWKQISELVITPEMENQTFLVWVEQRKMCARHIPQVLVVFVCDGKLKLDGGYHQGLDDFNWSLSEITHYTELGTPYE